MKPICFNFHLTDFFTSLQFIAQTWCETWVHVFKKSTSGQVIWSPHWLCKLSHYMYRGWHVLIAMHHFPSVAISQNYSVQCRVHTWKTQKHCATTKPHSAFRLCLHNWGGVWTMECLSAPLSHTWPGRICHSLILLGQCGDHKGASIHFLNQS